LTSITGFTDLTPGAATTPKTAPGIRDSWGNLVIYVPCSSPTPGTFTGGLGTTAAPGAVTAGGVIKTIQSPDGRGFWASAGPDGSFEAGDDNEYSFNQ